MSLLGDKSARLTLASIGSGGRPEHQASTDELYKIVHEKHGTDVSTSRSTWITLRARHSSCHRLLCTFMVNLFSLHDERLHNLDISTIGRTRSGHGLRMLLQDLRQAETGMRAGESIWVATFED